MKRLLIFCTLFSLFFVNCQNRTEQDVIPIGNGVQSDLLIPSTASSFSDSKARKTSASEGITPQIELMLEDIAKNIAENMDNLTLRRLLKQEALLKRDGDFDILISSIFNDKNEFKAITSKKDNAFRIRLTKYLEEYPKLNISIPLHVEKWDASSTKLLVAALRNHEEEILTAYGFNNIKMNLSHDLNPDLPVMVVGFNERIEIAKENKNEGKRAKMLNVPTGLGLQHTTPNSFYLTWLDVTGESSYEIHRSTGGNFNLFATTSANNNFLYITGLTAGQKYYFKIRSIINGVPSAWSQLIASSASPRNDGQPLNVASMKFNDGNALSVVEKWASGAPEMRLRVIVSPGGSTSISYTTPKLEPPTRNSITDQYWIYSVPLLSSWSSANTVLRFNWREEDWNDNATFGVSAGYEDKIGGSESTAGTIKLGATLSVPNDPGKDLIADTDVFYWDTASKVYSSTIFKFILN